MNSVKIAPVMDKSVSRSKSTKSSKSALLSVKVTYTKKTPSLIELPFGWGEGEPPTPEDEEGEHLTPEEEEENMVWVNKN
jgi:hypothetical protein